MKPTVAVLFGGRSVEHDVSIISGIQAYCALDRTKYDVLPIYLSRDSQWYTGTALGDIETFRRKDAWKQQAVRVVPVADNGRVLLVRYPVKKWGDPVVAAFDVALPVVHGTNSEDGTLMGMLDMLGVPYAGCDVAAAALSMDKYALKAVLRQAGLPVLDALAFTARAAAADPEDTLDAVEARFAYPVVVKPVNLGSSVGISRADDRAALQRALDTACEYAPRVLVEPAVQPLREINCAVLGDGDGARASVCEEPLNAHDILDFDAKYLQNAGKAGSAKSGMSSLARRLPAELPDELTARIQTLAVQAFQALGCSGVARIDFLLKADTEEVWINEPNTIPGSLAFYLWEAAGLPFDQLLNEMLALAFKRQRERAALTLSYDTPLLDGISLGGVKGAKGGKLRA